MRLSRTALAAAALIASAPAAIAQDVRARLPEDEVIYFLLPDRFENGDPANDRGGLSGDRLRTGFDPTGKGFYHGGDLKGIRQRIPYLKALGITAIWVAPIFRNKPVQGSPGHESAGYHGYWITDFEHVDPHLGSDADFKALVDAAHAGGMKVYMDIVVNHTADVIRYRECAEACPYRSIADYPFARRGGVTGPAINPTFAGYGDRSVANFAKLTDPTFAYTPFVPKGVERAKSPAWLNDELLYHNRGNSTFAGESSTYGDFVGLDDIATEHPRVVSGMIDIFGGWIDRFGVDGFRIDTARHVDPEFWQAFVPAMQARAEAKGIPNFHIFGEVATPDVAVLTRHTRVDKLPAVLDFAFARTVNDVAAGKAGTDRLAEVFAADPLYEGGESAARRLPTFLGNHDQGRAAYFLRRALPQASDAELLARDGLQHAMLLLLRGVPTIYAGDEQGFVGDGDDQDAREDLFASRVASYNDNRLLGTETTNATAHFGTANPLFRGIAALARVRVAHPALTRGRQVTRASEGKPGLFAASRFDPATGQEYLIAFNSAPAAIVRQVQVGAGEAVTTIAGDGCAAQVSAPGSLQVRLAPFGHAVCRVGAP